MLKKLLRISLISLVFIVMLFGCASYNDESRDRQITVLHINDVYRIDGLNQGEDGGLARVRSLRRSIESEFGNTLFLHGGDLLYPSKESEVFEGKQMIDVLNQMDGDSNRFDGNMFAVFGNHEFDKGSLSEVGILERAVKGSKFSWLASNIDFTGSKVLDKATNILQNKIVTLDGIKIGLFGISTDIKTPNYAKIGTNFKAVAATQTEYLRSEGVDLVVALTHLSLEEDKAILSLGNNGPDVIFGGHEHDSKIVKHGGRYIIKADADALTASVTKIILNKFGKLLLEPSIVPLNETIAPDAAVQDAVQKWKVNYSNAVCDFKVECGSKVLGKTDIELIGVEKRMRRYETNLGNWLADVALKEFEAQGAQIAFLNSGGIRLNQNIPSGSDLTAQHLDDLLPFDTELVLLDISGEELGMIVNRAIQGWEGNGWWLQIGGFAYTHDSQAGVASNVYIRENNEYRKLEPDERIRAVTTAYLINKETNQDGYTFLGPHHVVNPAHNVVKLKAAATAWLKQAQIIAPELEGRICNPERN